MRLHGLVRRAGLRRRNADPQPAAQIAEPKQPPVHHIRPCAHAHGRLDLRPVGIAAVPCGIQRLERLILFLKPRGKRAFGMLAVAQDLAAVCKHRLKVRLIPHIEDLDGVIFRIMRRQRADKPLDVMLNLRLVHTQPRPAGCRHILRAGEADGASGRCRIQRVFISLFQPIRRALRDNVDDDPQAAAARNADKLVQIGKIKASLCPLDRIPYRPQLYRVEAQRVHVLHVLLPVLLCGMRRTKIL